MKLIMLFAMITLMITNMIMMINNFISKKSISDREKMSPFECGFDPNKSARLPFSLQFFLIAVIFLVFDVEITLIMPMIIITKISNIMVNSLTMIMFILILLLGLYHEWNQGALNWAY